MPLATRRSHLPHLPRATPHQRRGWRDASARPSVARCAVPAAGHRAPSRPPRLRLRACPQTFNFLRISRRVSCASSGNRQGSVARTGSVVVLCIVFIRAEITRLPRLPAAHDQASTLPSLSRSTATYHAKLKQWQACECLVGKSKSPAAVLPPLLRVFVVILITRSNVPRPVPLPSALVLAWLVAQPSARAVVAIPTCQHGHREQLEQCRPMKRKTYRDRWL